MRVGVPKERADGERRVGLVPDVIRKLAARNLEVVVEAGAGEGAMLPDAAFTDAGAQIGDPWSADVLVKVSPPSAEEAARIGSDTVLVGFLAPRTRPDVLESLAGAGATAFAMEAIPRISRAQSMDALSSQSNVAGYKAVLVAATEMGRFYPMLMTAAGTIPPAKVLVLGAGVAGLQAIATARRLGAVVTGYDVRSAVKEQVESLVAKFLELEAVGQAAEDKGGYAKAQTSEEQARTQAALANHIKDMDLVISTAAVPGKRAPVLITEAMVHSMKPGSVIVDLAAETG